MTLLRSATLAVAAVSLAFGAAAQLTEPLHVRNLNPLVAVFGLPAWDAVPLGTRFGVTTEVANHYRFSVRGNDLLMLDGETVRTNFALSHGFAGGWSLGVEVPHFHVGGGVLDDLIDGWHSAFRLPDGGRNARPEGALFYRFGRTAAPEFELMQSASGIGDTQIKLARLVGEEQRFVVQATLKLPTGDPDVLMGSGSADVGVTVLRSQALVGRRRPAGYYWGVGLLRPGDAERIPFEAEALVPTAVVGGSWQVFPKLGFKGQIDVHGAFFDSALEELGRTAIQATIGGWRPLGRRGVFEFGVVEDLEVSTAPDVVLQAAATWQW
jgi:hypothetical protein